MREHVEPAGILATELTRTAVDMVGMRTADALGAAALEQWLLAQELAVRGRDGRLRATKLGASIGGSLRALEGNAP